MSLGRSETTASDGNMGVSVCPGEEGDSRLEKRDIDIALKLLQFSADF